MENTEIMPPSVMSYNGITLSYYSNEHDPIHVHATYGGRDEYEMKVEFYIDKGKITTIKYKAIGGKKKEFKPAQKHDLEKLVSSFKQELVDGWVSYFIKHVKPKFRIIQRL